MPCAASPPSTFCHENVVTSHLVQSIGCANDGAGGVVDGDAFAVGGDPIEVRHPHARRRAVLREDDVGVLARQAEIRQRAVGGA